MVIEDYSKDLITKKEAAIESFNQVSNVKTLSLLGIICCLGIYGLSTMGVNWAFFGTAGCSIIFVFYLIKSHKYIVYLSIKYNIPMKKGGFEFGKPKK